MFKFNSALMGSLALHVVLGAVLLISFDFHSVPQQIEISAPNFQPIEAVVVDQKTIENQLKRIEQQKEAERQKELQKQRDEARRKREAEQRRQDEARKKQRQIEDKKRREQAAADAKERERKAQEEAQRKENERKQRELERRAAQERERKAREKREAEEQARKEAERKQQEQKELQEMERLMQEQLQAEQAARSQQRQKHVLTETERYTALINAKIVQNWYTDDSMIGKSCRINIRLSSTGFVIQVRVIEGDRVVCTTGEQAIRRAGDMPMSSDPDVYNKLRDITFNFGF
ncbi:cell envelope integrity protein TolA [Aliiglaciecola sp. M165]|uniref:cell envelope integrity protein TolA n=1 Tax=Aliiglaciecola sp. M165 TaxID=2593649 RepID=UPI00117C545C|nr:cell envelope integrity protein TolA [Aliiglaciecola sp. M165]TRY31035.1 cell envelope integrity protein TolA [Aliiglaciecola sp. M165]